MVGRRKLAEPSLNHIFNALLIGVQYPLSVQLTNFGLKCLLVSLIELIKCIVFTSCFLVLFLARVLKSSEKHKKII